MALSVDASVSVQRMSKTISIPHFPIVSYLDNGLNGVLEHILRIFPANFIYHVRWLKIALFFSSLMHRVM